MATKLKDIKIIGMLLMTLYGTAFAFYILTYLHGNFHPRAGMMVALLGVLFLASMAVVRLKEWGRIVLVIGNAIMGFFLLFPYLIITDIIPLSFIFMNIAMLLFFNQENIKQYFSGRGYITKSGDWKCILLIDDDPTLVKTIRPILISNGYSVLTAENGEEGLKVARTQKPDMILLDVILPGIKGRDVCKELKDDGITKDIPVVFLTAKDSQDDINAEKAMGAVGHITKPVNARILIEIVQKVLGS